MKRPLLKKHKASRPPTVIVCGGLSACRLRCGATPQIQSLLVAEVTLEEAFEATAVTSFVAGHFMNSVVNGIEIQLFGAFGYAGLVLARTAFGVHALLQIRFGVPHDIAQQFGKFRGMLSLFPGLALESLGYFGITLAVGLTAHGKIHTYFGALAHEVVVEVFYHLLVATFGHAYLMFGHEREAGVLCKFLELGGGHAAHGAFFGSMVTFVNVTAYGANEFLLHDVVNLND